MGGKDQVEDSPSLAEWVERVGAMYAAWAKRRRMQVAHATGKDGRPLLVVSGFGAYRTLRAEAGLHILEDTSVGAEHRDVARVRVVGGPDEALEGPVLVNELTRLVGQAEKKRNVVRRYREQPSPLVRDSASGLRSGNLDQVLGGDFDLVFPAPES
jgi:ATP-dependent Clp protease ATP-binding subunit ClpC